jgi:hypothetical protein
VETDNYAAVAVREHSVAEPFVDEGIACQWGKSASGFSTIFAWGPIAPDQAKKQEAALESKASDSGKNEHGGTYYTLTQQSADGANQGGNSTVYVFSPKGYWALSQNLGVGDVIDQVVENAPEFY